MTHYFRGILLFAILHLLLIFSVPGLANTNLVHHQLSVQLLPDKAHLHVKDVITLPRSISVRTFQLNGNLRIVNSSVKITRVSNDNASDAITVSATRYRIHSNDAQITIEYEGKIENALTAVSKEYARSFQNSSGIISEQGVYLTGASGWYPVFSGVLLTFKLEVKTPKQWQAVSQGEAFKLAEEQVRWTETNPQDAIYLIASTFKEYRKNNGTVEAMVYLRDSDDALAEKYIDTTFRYINMYSSLLGKYPYKKFAMVENFWETGFGMPSFTLLGPRVLRFPFILHSSYPHEILHNWWGNGVFVDYAQGNWAEGLTAYLADHLIKEQRQQGTNHRRDVLQKYNDYVNQGKDFKLSAFKSRHSSASEAVGYGKTLMLFHMLRQKLGDRLFVQALRNLYRDYQFREASFTDIKNVFSAVSNEQLDDFFAQWLNRTGAPELKIKTFSYQKDQGEYLVKLTLQQIQSGPAYALNIPIVLALADKDEYWKNTVDMDAKEQTYQFRLSAKPLELKVDPQFDVFRRLDNREIPSALSQGFGAPQVTIILPAKAEKSLLEQYQTMATSWSNSQPGNWQVYLDTEISELPAEGSVWVLGWENKWTPQFKTQLKSYPINWSKTKLTYGSRTHDYSKHALVLTARNPANTNHSILWLASSNAKAIPGLTRKLPHYRKYSYLAFEGDEPTNITKGQWATTDSPLTKTLEKDKIKANPETRPALAQLPAVPVGSE